MKCPECGSPSHVYDSRDGVRQRKCKEGHAFTTHEVIAGEAAHKNKAASKVPLGPMQAAVLETLAGRSLTAVELTAAMPGKSRTAVMDAVRSLRHRRLLYIAGYGRRAEVGGRKPPRYAVGQREDAKEPSVPKIERDRAWRAKKRTSMWSGLMFPPSPMTAMEAM